MGDLLRSVAEDGVERLKDARTSGRLWMPAPVRELVGAGGVEVCRRLRAHWRHPRRVGEQAAAQQGASDDCASDRDSARPPERSVVAVRLSELVQTGAVT